MSWSQENILKLIQNYKNKQILWDTKDPHYYNKMEKNKAWQEIALEMNEDEEECKRKMTSLLASLRREKSKILKSKQQGKAPTECYKSSWFAFKHMGFLLCKRNPDSPKQRNQYDEETISRNNEIQEIIKIEPVFVEHELSLELPVAKRRKTMSEPEEIRTINQSSLLPPKQQTLDECESFGVFVSNKLKNYTQSTRNMAQHLISNILFEADQGNYDKRKNQTSMQFEQETEEDEY